jgi:hypothetical protein
VTIRAITGAALWVLAGKPYFSVAVLLLALLALLVQLRQSRRDWMRSCDYCGTGAGHPDTVTLLFLLRGNQRKCGLFFGLPLTRGEGDVYAAVPVNSHDNSGAINGLPQMTIRKCRVIPAQLATVAGEWG